jgi:hypothetical protein
LRGKLGLPSLQIMGHHLSGLSSLLALVFSRGRCLNRVDVLLSDRLDHRLGALRSDRDLRGCLDRSCALWRGPLE